MVLRDADNILDQMYRKANVFGFFHEDSNLLKVIGVFRNEDNILDQIYAKQMYFDVFFLNPYILKLPILVLDRYGIMDVDIDCCL